MKKFIFSQINIVNLPGWLLAYWMNKDFISMFMENRKIGDIYELNSGIKTGNNDLFLRLWHEVNYSKIFLSSQKNTSISSYKWFFYNKGGGYKKWYGGYEYVINFEKNGDQIKKNISKSIYRLRNPENYFKEAIIWPLIGDVRFSARVMPSNVLPDVSCNAIFLNNLELLGYMNSTVFNECMKFINSTVSYPIDSVASVPYKEIRNKQIQELCIENINFVKMDCDEKETSWGFLKHPLV